MDSLLVEVVEDLYINLENLEVTNNQFEFQEVQIKKKLLISRNQMNEPIEFVCIPNAFPLEEITNFPLIPTEDHPLRPAKAISVVDKTKQAQFAPEFDGFDPLSQLAAEAELVSIFSVGNFSHSHYIYRIISLP